jgi:hypothetical protein
MEEKVCHCSHKESDHVEAKDSDDVICLIRGCRCIKFIEMDPDDLEFIKSLEG